jgi:KipI family sensor histidine kinase inhibitor
MKFPRIESAAENAITVYFAEEPSEVLTRRIMGVVETIKGHFDDALIDSVPSYVTLVVVYDTSKLSRAQAHQLLWTCVNTPRDTLAQAPCKHVLPVFYTEQYCPDLTRVAQLSDVSVNTIVEWHTACAYSVYAMGFAPGFAYLGELDERLQFPRLSTPRMRVPAGSVAIAERQTAVYPMASPGGWHVLGLCPSTMFDLHDDPSTPFTVGDEVVFEAIDEAQFLALGGQLNHVEAVNQ